MNNSLQEKLISQLHPYVPDDSVHILVAWIVKYGIQLSITRSRKTILGDYRWPQNGKGHRITVNGDLNRYAFLITFVHEMAHLITWQLYRNKVLSHGKEWKQEFRKLMNEFAGRRIFPLAVKTAMKNHIVKPSFTHCMDKDLMQALSKYDEPVNSITVRAG